MPQQQQQQQNDYYLMINKLFAERERERNKEGKRLISARIIQKLGSFKCMLMLAIFVSFYSSLHQHHHHPTF